MVGLLLVGAAGSVFADVNQPLPQAQAERDRPAALETAGDGALAAPEIERTAMPAPERPADETQTPALVLDRPVEAQRTAPTTVRSMVL
jgi:hypothetical protein